MKNCPRCNALNDDAAVSCQHCGINFPPRPSQPNMRPQPAQYDQNYSQFVPPPAGAPTPTAGQPLTYPPGFAPYPYPPMMVYPPAPDPVALKNQRKIQKIIAYYAQRGYKVVSQTDTTVQLTKDKSFSCLAAVILLLLWILPFFIYLIYYASKKEERLLITLNPDGSTTFAFNDDKPITKYPVNGEAKFPLRDDSALFIALIAIGILLIVAYALMTAR